ncbi:MAG: imidazole glycerol phosphate synthase subunit HisH, partial [Bacteroidales bacterium]|nr:imidazole glycerol phosphate synthase subunit HisH [Bacteroidales bacterium]
DAEGLGIFDAMVRRFSFDDPSLKVPHMGWNTVGERRSPLLQGFYKDPFVYYVHSYYASLCEDTIGVAVHGIPFSAALGKGNFYGTQFHPEKSGAAGERILKNFLGL